MRTFCAALLLGMAGMGWGQKDELPANMRLREHRTFIKASSLRVGEMACLKFVSGSYEHHIWITMDDFYRGGLCIQDVQRVEGGWRVWLDNIPIGEIDHDSTFARLGYVRAKEVISGEPKALEAKRKQ